MDVYKNFMVNSTTRFFVTDVPSILILMREKFGGANHGESRHLLPLFQPGYLNERVTQYHKVHLHQLLCSVSSVSLQQGVCHLDVL